MVSHPRRRAHRSGLPLSLGFALGALVLAGCGVDRGAVGPASLDADPGRIAVAANAPTGGVGPRAQTGHAWFSLTPGRYADFRIRRFTVEAPTYVRVTVARPEVFFGRPASPWVYGEVPGLPVDATLNGLRQYYSLAPDGALWFHGAQNLGFMSHTEPPVRQLSADPVPGAAWVDTVFFESFFPGGIPFFSATQTYAFKLSERAFLDLPGGPVHALRSSVVIDELDGFSARGVAIATAAYGGESLAPFAEGRATAGDGDEAPVARARDRGDRGEPAALKGLWFARQRGLVARDFPQGPGPGNINITTYERLGEGFGPVPPPTPAPNP